MTVKASSLCEGDAESMDSQFLRFMFVSFLMVTIFYLIVAYFSFCFVICRSVFLAGSELQYCLLYFISESPGYDMFVKGPVLVPSRIETFLTNVSQVGDP
jgi:hypothetical protein